MAYPSGSGSERLQRGTIHNQTVSADTSFRFDGGIAATGTSTYAVPANHIITVLKIIITEVSNAARTFQLIVIAGGVNMNLVYQQSVLAKDTFIWNEKIVLHPTDKLLLGSSASSNFDVHYTYVDQDWS